MPHSVVTVLAAYIAYEV